MAIEFRCPGCQKLLRTQDDTAGKQAKCPQCGTIVAIPPAASAAPSSPPNPPPAAGAQGAWADPAAWQAPPVQAPRDPFAGQAAGGWAPGNAEGGAAGYNPYQSPNFGSGYAKPSTSAGRHGPAWEREGPSMRSYVDTIQECATDVQQFFATMRREGGVGAPLGFAFVGIVVAMVANLTYEFFKLGAANFLPNNPNAAQLDGPETAVGFVCMGIAFPVAAVVGLFISAGIYHLFLMMLGGANSTFEATFRAVAYATGITNLVQVVPCCGAQIGGLLAIVLTIIGLANVHETSGWKASGAVLLPLAVCCCLLVGAVATIVGFAAQQQQLFLAW